MESISYGSGRRIKHQWTSISWMKMTSRFLMFYSKSLYLHHFPYPEILSRNHMLAVVKVSLRPIQRSWWDHNNLSAFSKNTYRDSFDITKGRSLIKLITPSDHWRTGSVLLQAHIPGNHANIVGKIITILCTANISDPVNVLFAESLAIRVTGVGKETKVNWDHLDKEKERVGKVIMTMDEVERKRSGKSTN